jgi:hypothetical protein
MRECLDVPHDIGDGTSWPGRAAVTGTVGHEDAQGDLFYGRGPEGR